MAIRFEITARSSSSGARVGRIETLHGAFDTPAFMTIGTRATVKGLLPELVRRTGSQIILNNAYHLLLRPGPELVAQMGGLHRFQNWDGPILTDSGGFQAYSMADTNAIDDDGVTFRSIVDGARIRMTPEESIRVQNLLGANIIMAMDDCPPSVETDQQADSMVRRKLAAARRGPGYDHARRLAEARERTARWLVRCRAAHRRPEEQALFGIVQGGTDLEARTLSARDVTGVDLPGYAIGGVAVGEPADQIARVVAHTAPLLPADRPRYLMGVGYERDIVAAVIAGVDMFDCVLPTRNGRNATAFTREGRLRLRNEQYRADPGPIEAGCDCPACGAGGAERPTPEHGATRQGPFSRGYIRHLFQAGEMLGPILVSLHNVRHFQRLMLDIRRAIREDDWSGLARDWPQAAPGIPNQLLAAGGGRRSQPSRI
ncbi:MAG: tRNA guanosine(34) transglycosylase Tgt [Phycisphaerales bacterium JB039]